MARRAKKENGGEGVSALRGNGYDKEQTQSFVDRIERLQDEIDEHMAEAREACEEQKADIKGVKAEAKAAGLPKKELNAILSKRKKLRAADAIRAKLAPEEQDNFDNLEQAIGMFADSPLGAHALRKHRGEGDVIHA